MIALTAVTIASTYYLVVGYVWGCIIKAVICGF